MKPAVLLIHGFTGHYASLGLAASYLKREGYRYEYPILTGHGTKPEDLTNVRWPDWENDVRTAFEKLQREKLPVVIIALSMGSLLAIELAARQPDAIKGLVLLSPCVVFKNKLAPLTPLVQPLIKRFPFPGRLKFSTPEGAATDRGYQWFPTAAYRSYWERTRTIFVTAKKISCPTRIIQSTADHVADPRGATRLAAALGGPHELIWHHYSGHELLLDVEAESVLEEIVAFPVLKEG